MYALIGVLVEDGRVLLFGGNDSNLASELEGTLNNVVGDDVKLLLLLALVDENLAYEVTHLSKTVKYLHVDGAATTFVPNHPSDRSAVNQIGNRLACLP